MEIFFKHVCGNTRKNYPSITKALAFVSPHEEKEALEKGWLMAGEELDGKEVWIQLRSERVALANFTLTKKQRQSFHKTQPQVTRKIQLTVDRLALTNVINNYLKFKQYDYTAELILRDLNEQDFLFAYYVNNELVAAHVIRSYDSPDVISTRYFLWNYKNPSLGLGSFAHMDTLLWAKEQGYEYVYHEGGYGKSVKYKASYRGFEFWTGREWCNDRERYKKLCDAEDEIDTLAEAAAYERKFFPELYVDLM